MPDQDPDGATRNLADGADRRRAVAVAGHLGDTTAARAALTDEDPGVRASALTAVWRAGALTTDDLRIATSDHAPIVRRRVAEVVARLGAARAAVDQAAGGRDAAPDPSAVDEVVLALLDDGDDGTLEGASFAAGEWFAVRRDDADAAARLARAVSRLSTVATAHDDALCREAAAAALGAIGDERGKPAVLQALSDKATVRRRAVVALAAFDGPDVDAAIERALADRDWQVRQIAEDLAGPAPSGRPAPRRDPAIDAQRPGATGAPPDDVS